MSTVIVSTYSNCPEDKELESVKFLGSNDKPIQIDELEVVNGGYYGSEHLDGGKYGAVQTPEGFLISFDENPDSVGIEFKDKEGDARVLRIKTRKFPGKTIVADVLEFNLVEAAENNAPVYTWQDTVYQDDYLEFVDRLAISVKGPYVTIGDKVSDRRLRVMLSLGENSINVKYGPQELKLEYIPDVDDSFSSIPEL
jgi:hypothetical protein